MRIIFTKDYTGRETAMQERKAGDEMDCGAAFGLALIELGVADEVELVDVRTFADPEPVYISGVRKRKPKVEEE